MLARLNRGSMDHPAITENRDLSAPSHYIARGPARIPQDVVLSDGSVLRLRELQRGDRERFKAFFTRCSVEAIRYRFMSSIKGPSNALLDNLVDTDGSRHVALIVTRWDGAGEKIVAEGRYVRFNERPEVADIGFPGCRRYATAGNCYFANPESNRDRPRERRSGPFNHTDNRLYNRRSGRGFYFEDPNGHLLEVMTVPETGS